ncbi:hypothetical protein [Mesorhizobium sp. M0643]|uniref:hypothetical protein n=1 Tax=unclassified Mesorhizobium TaxID=325217 RepID=UPI00333760FE
MSDFVQRLDLATGSYIKIEVRSGKVIGEPSKRRFADADEIEPIEVERARLAMSDPLGDFR